MIPKLATDELVEQLQNYRRTGEYSEMDLRRVQRDAESIKSKRPSEGHMLLGMLACLNEDPTEVRNHHEASLRATGNEPIFLRNYATSIGSLGFRSEAKALQERAFRASPDDVGELNEYASGLLAAGRFHELHQLMLEQNMETLAREEIHIDRVKSITDAAAEQGVSDDDFELAIESANAIMHRCGFHLSNIYPILIGFGRYAWLSYQITPVRTRQSSDIVYLNDMLIEDQVENPKIAFDCSLLVSRFALVEATEAAV